MFTMIIDHDYHDANGGVRNDDADAADAGQTRAQEPKEQTNR